MDIGSCCELKRWSSIRKIVGYYLALSFLGPLFFSSCSMQHAPPSSTNLPEPVPTVSMASQVRLIIKFNSSITDPSALDFRQRLSADIGEALEYVRPMFGDAHVFVTTNSLTDVDKNTLLEILSSHGDVKYVEEDIFMQPMKHQ